MMDGVLVIGETQSRSRVEMEAEMGGRRPPAQGRPGISKKASEAGRERSLGWILPQVLQKEPAFPRPGFQSPVTWKAGKQTHHDGVGSDDHVWGPQVLLQETQTRL